MFKDLKHWWKYTTKQNVHIKVYQVYLIMLIEALIVILIMYNVMKIHKYKYIDENDKRGYAINCYQTKDELRCYIDQKVKQYGGVKWMELL